MTKSGSEDGERSLDFESSEVGGVTPSPIHLRGRGVTLVDSKAEAGKDGHVEVVSLLVLEGKAKLLVERCVSGPSRPETHIKISSRQVLQCAGRSHRAW